jgi:Ca2+-dependent lipid-binding protein
MNEEQKENERRLWKSVVLQYYLLAGVMFLICLVGGWFFGYGGFVIPAAIFLMIFAALYWRINH